MRRVRAYRSPGFGRSLTLLRTFVAASALILAVGAVALSSTLSSKLRAAALEDNARDAAAYVDTALAPSVVRGDTIVVTPRAQRLLRRAVTLRTDVQRIDIYSRTGVLRFSTSSAAKIGKRRASADVKDVLRDGTASAAVVNPPGHAPTFVLALAPLRTDRDRPVGVAELALSHSLVTDTIAESERTIWVAVLVVFAVLWLALAGLARGAAQRLRAQNEALADRSHDLLESSRELEATLLETIETLNAAVEARDPYTAGHAQRVRRISLAIGRELRLPTKQLGSLATAALFHDIGKIGMPDSILTKPGTLDRAEAALMREHVDRGAEIVARISSLKDSVPAIRHHHERWDGLGYPDRLSGKDVPLESAIIAIADAWDAMTTDRPYALALDVDEAMLQIHAGRGKQFNPVVVDAFLSVVRRRPDEILPPEAEVPVVGTQAEVA
jgi:putative nucleotidyltransferase with HDIG domain